MNRAILDLGLVSAVIATTASHELAGFVFGFGAVCIIGREIAKIEGSGR